MKTFYSNGKLLLTGEYVVLEGAKALAIPTKKGQSLTVKSSSKKGIHWKSLDDKGKIWFEARFQINDFVSEKENKVLFQLIRILKEAQRLKPSFLSETHYEVITQLDFPVDWGLGTSSTLINNIAQWADIDAFQLLHNSFGGSGYDIAAAQHNSPILYQLEKGKPVVREVKLDWDFTQYLFFVHLNQKQDSKEGIKQYKSATISEYLFSEINTLTTKLIDCKTLFEFENLLEKHETIISKNLEILTVKQKLFPDYSKTIKSLGAWGGDFILAIGGEKEKSFFREKGFITIVPFEEMIL